MPRKPLVIYCAVLGLVIGSFLNVVIHRVPREQPVIGPPSSCPRCGHRIKFRDNIPLLSWLLLRGRCRSCSSAVPVRYPLVEAGTAVLFGVCAWRFDEARLPVMLYLTGLGVALAMIDFEHHRLPLALTVPALPVTAAALIPAGVRDGWATLPTALECAVVWGGWFAALWWLTRGRGMGFGDVVLAPTLGLILGWFGWGAGLVGLLSSFATGALVGVALMAAGRAGRRTALPFGPFMLIGTAIGLFVGQPLWHTYLVVSGISALR